MTKVMTRATAAQTQIRALGAWPFFQTRSVQTSSSTPKAIPQYASWAMPAAGFASARNNSWGRFRWNTTHSMAAPSMTSAHSGSSQGRFASPAWGNTAMAITRPADRPPMVVKSKSGNSEIIVFLPFFLNHFFRLKADVIALRVA